MASLKDHAAGRLVWPLFFVFALAVGSLLLHWEKGRRFKQLREERARFAAVVAARPIDQVKANRARFYKTGYYLDYPATVSHAIADLLSRLNGIIRPLRLLDAQFDPGLRDLKFTLTVAIEAADRGSARQKLALFIEKLRAFPELTQLSWTGRDPAGPESRLRVFSVSGQSEWL